MVNLARRQHVVSNFYLRGFADDRRRVRRVELPGNRRYIVATNNASVVKDFYTITLPDGTRSDAFERMFGDIEDIASSALRARVVEREWPLVRERREALASSLNVPGFGSFLVNGLKKFSRVLHGCHYRALNPLGSTLWSDYPDP